MKPKGPLTQALRAEAIEGEVVLTSPGKGDVQTALTPSATSNSLKGMKAAAEQAARQQQMQQDDAEDQDPIPKG